MLPQSTRRANALSPGKGGGIQRVKNWTRRGIPPRVKLDHPQVFLSQLRREQAGQRASQLVEQAA